MSTPRPARGDADACFAASESEIGLMKAGRLRAAVDQLTVCAARSCPSEVREECSRRLVVVNAAMPTLVLGATDTTGNDVVAVTVMADGVPFTQALDGRALSIDPGRHTLRFEAPGVPPLEKVIVAREGEKGRHVTVVLGGPPSGAASPAVAPGAAPAVTVTPAAPESPPPAPYWGGQRSLAVATAGLGLAGVVVGSVFGLEASADWSASKSDCSSKSSCTNPAGALAAHSSTVTEGAVSTTAFAVGAVGLAAGVVL